jgi:hypothetical protein
VFMKVACRLPGFAPGTMAFLIATLAVLTLSACGDDCRKKIQQGDFEFSQGNYSRAMTLYGQAEASGACSDAAGKKQKAMEMRDHQKDTMPPSGS